jgi:hypothetical protein
MTNEQRKMKWAKIKDWFGQGEHDVDLMLRLGAVRPATITRIYKADPSSPYLKDRHGFPHTPQTMPDLQTGAQIR